MSHQAGVGPATGAMDTTKRWLWRALVLSLSINLLVAGVFIGEKWSRHWSDAHGRGYRGDGFASTLEGERRQLFSELDRSRREQARTFHKVIRTKQAAALQLLKEEPFDRDRFIAAVEEILSERAAGRRQLAERFIAMVDQMTPEERGAYVTWYETRRGHRR